MIVPVRDDPAPGAVAEKAVGQMGEEARHQLAAIVAGSGDAIFGVTTDGTITSWNPAA
jgi:PAS domain-containing protein